jgi:hypothetical protein
MEERVNTYQEMLDGEIGTVPPSTVDVEWTIRRRRRIRRFQRAGGAASALVVVGLLAVVALRVAPAGPPRFGAPPDPTPSAPSSAPVPSPSMTDSEDGPPLVDEPAAVRLTAALKRAMAARLPQAEFVTNRTRPPEEVAALVFNHRYRLPAPNRGGEDYYYATADVKQADGTGSIEVLVGRLGTGLFTVPTACAHEGPLDAKSFQCEPSSGPHEETVVTNEVGFSQTVEYEVFVARPDGVGVMIFVRNATLEHSHDDLRSAPTPPLTRTQARELALDPVLTL